MQEKVLNRNKNGMLVLLAGIAAVVLGFAGFIWGLWAESTAGTVISILGILAAILASVVLCGLRVLKPQEALVLTLFGKYIGTLKGEGFYWVNPFCTSVNPAAGTVLNQSGDVKSTKLTEPAGMKMSTHLPSRFLCRYSCAS